MKLVHTDVDLSCFSRDDSEGSPSSIAACAAGRASAALSTAAVQVPLLSAALLTHHLKPQQIPASVQSLVGVALMLRSCSPVGSWSISTNCWMEGMGRTQEGERGRESLPMLQREKGQPAMCDLARIDHRPLLQVGGWDVELGWG